MKTMRNEYRDLKKENDLIFSTLAEYDRDTITEIISVADNTRGIGYEIELIRKDLIAMAAQAEARRDYLPSVIGDVEVFKRNLLASMPKPKFADYMADSLVWLCTFALVSTATYTVMGRAWDCYYDAVWLVLCIAIMMPVRGCCSALSPPSGRPPPKKVCGTVPLQPPCCFCGSWSFGSSTNGSRRCCPRWACPTLRQSSCSARHWQRCLSGATIAATSLPKNGPGGM